MTYYIGIYTEEKMKIKIITDAPNAEKALQQVIKEYPYGIVTFIYRE